MRLLKPMRRGDLAAASLLVEILLGVKREAMGSAKRLIVSRAAFVPSFLAAVVSERRAALSARVAAAYAFGFIGGWASARPLLGVLRDASESADLRSHVAEALGNIADSRALEPLGDTLLSENPPSLKLWCIYAITEIGGTRALAILSEFDDRRRRGRLREELEKALKRLAAPGG